MNAYFFHLKGRTYIIKATCAEVARVKFERRHPAPLPPVSDEPINPFGYVVD